MGAEFGEEGLKGIRGVGGLDLEVGLVQDPFLEKGPGQGRVVGRVRGGIHICIHASR